MIEISTQDSASTEFKLALTRLAEAELRRELSVTEIAAPKGLAQNAVAFSAQLADSDHSHGHVATGRFVFLWDKSPQDAWAGNFRIVCFVKSNLEPDIADDERISDVALAWLSDALRRRNAVGEAAAGTTTRIVSSGFGSLASEPDHGELEIRASWSPTDDNFSGHLEAWQDLLCVMAGFSPLPDGVHPL